jgi:hypothetical protein
MKRSFEFLALVLMAGCIAWGQERPPSLGAPEPSSGLSTGGSATPNPQRLVRVKKIYLEPIDNNLNLKIERGLAKMGWATIVDNRENSDAILSGTCLDSPRLKTVHSEVFINDRSSGASIWQDEVRVPYHPPTLSEALDITAGKILLHLRASVEAAHSK